jgi:dTDP-4-dehydrorhamnose reductase
MKIAVVGANGMLGREVADYLSKNDNLVIHAFTRHVTDNVKNKYYFQYDHLFDRFDYYDYIINCAGVLRVPNKNLKLAFEAFKINTLLPFRISALNISNKIINIATDGVFSGRDGGYVETSKHDNFDVYGKTKSFGEVKSDRVYNLRCSIIGVEQGSANSLLSWFLNQRDGSSVNGYVNHLWNGITTLQFSKICANIILNNIQVDNLQHIVPKDKVSKYELLSLFNSIYKKNIKIIPIEDTLPVDRTLETLNDKKNKELWNHNVLSIEEMISDLHENKRTL